VPDDDRRQDPDLQDLEPTDLDLLASLEGLTYRQVLPGVTAAWKQTQGHTPVTGEWMDLRQSVARLERAGLVRSEPTLHLEVTDAGREYLAKHVTS
jgi:hypothetical protein